MLEGTRTRCRIDLEGWGEYADWVWSDGRPNPETPRNRFIKLAELLAELVDDPDVVTLIIPWDFAEAVLRRDGDESDDLERGSRHVVGRTIPAADGSISVIIDATSLLGADQHDPKDDAMRAVRRTLIHEAQHVIMYQRGSGNDAYESGAIVGSIDWEFVVHASKVCDEHRAEWQTICLTERNPPAVKDVRAALEALGRKLAAANRDYQGAPDDRDRVLQFKDAVLTACNGFWTSLGYWAAEHRTDDANIADMSTEITALHLWQRYARDAWASLQASLRTLPVENLTTSREILSAAGQQVAATLRSSLETIGFRYEETSSGGRAFYSTRLDFPDHGGNS